jgi:hypothetical protein
MNKILFLIIFSKSLIACCDRTCWDTPDMSREYRCCFKEDSEICFSRRENWAICTLIETASCTVAKSMCVPNNKDSSNFINAWCPYTSSCNTFPTIFEWTSTGFVALGILQCALVLSPCFKGHHCKRIVEKIYCCSCCHMSPDDPSRY